MFNRMNTLSQKSFKELLRSYFVLGKASMNHVVWKPVLFVFVQHKRRIECAPDCASAQFDQCHF